MDSKTRIPLLAAAGLGVGGLYYYFKKGEKSVFLDFLLPSATFAAGFNVIGVFVQGEMAKGNPSGMGALPSQAVEFLEHINPSDLFATIKKAGVKIAPVPDNPSVILQDDE